MINKINLIVVFIFVISLMVGVIAFPHLNEKFASHWNEKGEVNGYMSKTLGVLLMPLIMGVVFLFLKFLPRIDPFKKNFKSFKKKYDVFIVWFLLFLAYVHVLTIGYNLGYSIDIGKMMLPALGLFFILLGVLLEKTKRNWFVGIRTPWTLSSKEVWEKTHKLGGVLFKGVGVIVVFSFFIARFAYFVLIGCVVLISVIIVAYSYVLFKKEKKKK